MWAHIPIKLRELYNVTMEDPNRNAGVINIPYSVNVPMFISTTIVVNPLLIGPNSSPVLTFPPIDEGCVGVPFYHNPGASDPDGDSLAYELIHCKGEDVVLNILRLLPIHLLQTVFQLTL
jgi:hypothetical protein